MFCYEIGMISLLSGLIDAAWPGRTAFGKTASLGRVRRSACAFRMQVVLPVGALHTTENVGATHVAPCFPIKNVLAGRRL